MLTRLKTRPERRILVSEAPKKVLRFQRDPFFGHYGCESVASASHTLTEEGVDVLVEGMSWKPSSLTIA
jgi:hypothetical protein